MRLESLKIKYIIWLIPLIVLISLFFLVFFSYRSANLIKDSLAEFGFYLTEDLADAFELAVTSEDPILLQPSFDLTFDKENVVLIAVYNKRGNLIAFQKKIDELEEEISLEVVEKLTEQKESLKMALFTSSGEEFYYFYSPIFKKEGLPFSLREQVGEAVGFVKIGLSLEKAKTQYKETLIFGFIMTFFLIIFGIFIAFFLAGRMTRPINLLKQGVAIISNGDLNYRIKIETGDEIEKLAEDFNQMAESLQKSQVRLEESKAVLEVKVKARTKELKELADSLDFRVKEKTEELQEKIEELERFQRLAVGRELKMIELKEEIKKNKE